MTGLGNSEKIRILGLGPTVFAPNLKYTLLSIWNSFMIALYLGRGPSLGIKYMRNFSKFQTNNQFNPGDPTGLAVMISQVLADDAERLRVAEAGKVSVNQRFQLSQMISQTEAVYRQVCAAS